MSVARPRIAVVSLSPLARDARVQRQTRCVQAFGDVHVLGHGRFSDPRLSVTHHEVPHPPDRWRRLRKALLFPPGRVVARAYELWYWTEPEFVAAYRTLRTLAPDIIHANDWETLPLAARAAEATGARLILDLHEFAPEMRANRSYWRTFFAPCIRYFLTRYAHRAQQITTVNEFLVERYRQDFGIDAVPIANCPDIDERVQFHATNPDRIRMVQHGIADPDRGFDALIDTVSLLDARFSLHFHLIPHKAPDYIALLKAHAEKVAPGRVRFHEKVVPTEVPHTLSQYDIGFYMIPPSNFNNAYSCPNKFFEFMMAGLAVVISPHGYMAPLVERHQLGVVLPSQKPQAAAHILQQLGASEIDRMKQASLRARDLHNATTEHRKLEAIYRRLLGAGATAPT